MCGTFRYRSITAELETVPIQTKSAICMTHCGRK